MFVRKSIDHYCSVVPEKSQPSGPPFSGETRQASIPTGTVDPRVGIFLSPLNTNDGFYLSHTPYQPVGKTNIVQSHVGRTLGAHLSVTPLLCYAKITSPCRISAIQDFLEAFFILVHSGKQEKKSIIRVRMG